MIRVLIALIAASMVVLAFVLDQPWLYGAATVTLVGVLGYLARDFWDEYRREDVRPKGRMDEPVRPEATEPETGRDEALQERSGGEQVPSAPTSKEGASPAGTETPDQERMQPDGAAELPPEEEPIRNDASAPADEDQATEREAPAPSSPEQPVLGPYLEALRAAIGAQSVVLLVQEEVALEYQIEALASVQPGVHQSGMFETDVPLLTATMSRQPVTVRSMEEAGRSELGYYDTVPAITQIALAPVARPDTSATVFLLADATAEVDLASSQSRSLLKRFAETVAILLDADDPGVEQGEAFVPEDAHTGQNGTEAAVDEGAASPGDEPRPRREIIAEEMKAADTAGDQLALVLVHLNRAESIARHGEAAVTSAERHLRVRLEDLAPGQRVEKFGELTYGIFVRSGIEQVEGWAADLQGAMAQETGELEGGVSVGVAIRDNRHNAEGLRSDATDALLEAYQTGTCTIIT